ncbi:MULTISPECIES: helix-turn-helix domain-containing protein [unclassified Haloferax]|uniref:helix-turn-helix domain-containing protein n=1 Tax=unclassified Haloferax TaxID=2625095 RepID=UPI002876A98F|nr:MULTISPECIES: helix-turn-helix domain-containing protein [unclassified Haloferax]MDS0241710.1 helix-turn-helix domain-containing protein [Haloferax sp. S2CR25]MDS0444831.1 helix-turn-helix domain-containing protein [Haloferax sp. S2CR25-2]
MTETTDETSADPVTVLLVDDNRDWLTLVVHRLREVAPDFDVREANSPDDALDRLTDDVECVVSDYYMPGRTGIELLSEVREDRPDIPFLLFTGAGNEGLASSALSAGADDYIVKTSVDDSAAALATRVRTAVDKHRTERALAESEARYRTLVENVRDAIFVARDGVVVLVNEAATTLTGYDRAALTAGDIVETVVHPDDRARVRDALDRGVPQSLDIRIRNRGGETRHCILDTDDVVDDGLPGTIGVLRDITAQVHHQRRLERERDTKEAIREILVRQSSRVEVAESFCRYIGSDPDTVAAWVGERTAGGGLAPLAVVGDESYLRMAGVFDADAAVRRGSTEPSLTAFREGTTVVRAVGDEPDTDADAPATAPDAGWTAAAAAGGIETAVAVALRHGGVDYGVLGVYRRGADDDRERRRLEELAETLGYALSTAESREALVADEVVRVRLRVRDGDAGLLAVGDALGRDAELVVHTALPRGDSERYFVTVRGASEAAVTDALASLDGVTPGAVTPGDGVVRAQFDTLAPSLGTAIADAGGVLHRVVVVDGEATVVVDLSRRRPAGPFVEALAAAFDSVVMTARSHRTVESDIGASVLAGLTDRQRESLEVAYRTGYFERPKRRSAAEVAEAIGVSRSTFTQHLRAAQRKVFAELFDAE